MLYNLVNIGLGYGVVPQARSHFLTNIDKSSKIIMSLKIIWSCICIFQGQQINHSAQQYIYVKEKWVYWQHTLVLFPMHQS